MATMRAIGATTVLLAAAYIAPLAAAVQLVPVVGGLVSPVFATSAGDGSERMFVVEQGGVIRVVQAGTTTASVFLDISQKVIAGGEQGLLGLAFHPQYASNGRFFVYYTRSGDGGIVVAEYGASANRDVAATTESVLLAIPHPVNANHNGGMLAFGPDDYLYVGVGDGGSANDPPDNAQNLESLLGKILRIDVDHAAAPGVRYAVPADNPFVNAPGRDEIYAYGLRNPWRFSFDRVTGVLWVGDVGQNAREEVDMPVVRGGNYGWRVYEGASCTGNDPTLCDPENYRLPLFDYAHDDGRCSITGGFVYRGRQQALPGGTYVFADFCTGEIIAWDGTAQTVLLDLPGNVSSFGEDEHGEIYVVDFGGTVSRLAADTCTYTIAPTRETFVMDGGAGSIAVTAGDKCPWTAATGETWITLGGATDGSGNGTITYAVARYTGKPKIRTGTIVVAGRTFTITQNRLRPLVRRGG